MKARNVILHSQDAKAEIGFVIKARITPVTINAEIERALVDHADNPELTELLKTIDDVTSQTGKYAGDNWAATFLLKTLVRGDPTYPAMNTVSEYRIKKGIYGPVLRALGMHRIQRLKAYDKLKALEAQQAAQEELDHSGE